MENKHKLSHHKNGILFHYVAFYFCCCLPTPLCVMGWVPSLVWSSRNTPTGLDHNYLFGCLAESGRYRLHCIWLIVHSLQCIRCGWSSSPIIWAQIYLFGPSLTIYPDYWDLMWICSAVHWDSVLPCWTLWAIGLATISNGSYINRTLSLPTQA